MPASKTHSRLFYTLRSSNGSDQRRTEAGAPKEEGKVSFDFQYFVPIYKRHFEHFPFLQVMHGVTAGISAEVFTRLVAVLERP